MWEQTLPIAGTLVFVLDMVLSVLERAEGGAWYGDKFVYTTPQPVFTVYVTSDDNNKAFPIKLPMALPGAFVDLKVVVDRRDDRVKAQLNLAPSASLGWDNLPAVDRKHGMKLSRLVPV